MSPMKDDNGGKLVAAIARALDSGAFSPDPEDYAHDAAGLSARKDQAMRLARAVLSAIAREGWKVVPVEPTEAMRKQGEEAFDEFLTDPDGTVLTYQAMLSAAPKQG